MGDQNIDDGPERIEPGFVFGDDWRVDLLRGLVDGWTLAVGVESSDGSEAEVRFHHADTGAWCTLEADYDKVDLGNYFRLEVPAVSGVGMNCVERGEADWPSQIVQQAAIAMRAFDAGYQQAGD